MFPSYSICRMFNCLVSFILILKKLSNEGWSLSGPYPIFMAAIDALTTAFIYRFVITSRRAQKKLMHLTQTNAITTATPTIFYSTAG